ncbi:patatin-like phospholipase family protein [Gordonia hankookensis]|uniref:Patatin-like phospholipase family protein n=1 Tax=Gordonia hankookensis TaxID=589403 RepID=A0ABR7WHN1_9ACTN|nr:patatin-like phospholipase family protein [Gordonia hankookensis]MBD1321239.1 patatin-like phospholipase family protein [Gordonia hankookensis]NDZ96812.1 esterase [Streptomyces sp. SID11726]NEB23170.1 esterase [Streptomyces sp. SID6673]
MARPTRVALALGSGGARGYAHIGVIAELTERGFDVVTVAGSSMGALVGGLYCAGKLDEYVDWITGLSQLDVVRLMDVSLSKPGVIGAERILSRVREILGDARIEDLSIPFTAVATDLNVGRAVWFQRGPVVEAIRASIAIPGVISPHDHGGRLLADGGILDPLPVAPTSGVASDVTIGVVLGADGGPDHGATREPKTKRLLRRNVAPILDSDFVRSVRDRFGLEAAGGGELHDPAPTAEPDVETSRMGRIEVLSRSLDIMQEALTRYQVAGYPPDILIRVPRKSVRTLDFHKASEMIALGRSRTAEALDQLPELTL